MSLATETLREKPVEESFNFKGPNAWSIHARHWKRENARATLFGIHGYSEHSGSYIHFAEFLWSKGYEVLWVDLPGHGLSEGRRANIDDFDDYIRSVECFLTETSKRGVSQKPFYLFGHSLGGLVSIRFIQSSPLAAQFSRLILSSPLLGLGNYSSSFLPVLKWLTFLLPNITIPNEAELAGGVLTHDREMAAKREADPLIKSRITINWVREFLEARSMAFGDLEKIKIPVGLFQAGQEKVTDRKEAERFFSLLKSEKYLKTYEMNYHEILNEVNRSEVMNDMVTWLSR